MDEGNKSILRKRDYQNLQAISSSEDDYKIVVPKIVGSILPCPHTLLFSCSISWGNSGRVKYRWSKAGIYPVLIRELFSHCGSYSSARTLCGDRNFTNDAGGKLPPVSLTPVTNLPPVSLTPVVHLDLRISLQIFEKI
jgi:hypothetical protein